MHLCILGGGSKDCFKCGESGHISRECQNAASKGSCFIFNLKNVVLCKHLL